MNMLVFSDLHAQKESLQDIKSLLKEVDFSIFCGDLLGYGTDINECMDFILKKIDLVVLGNHDRMCISGENLVNQHPVVQESILYTRERLSPSQIQSLSSLKKEIIHQDLYITHSLGDDYLRSRDDFLRLIHHAPRDSKYIFWGHTHEQLIFKWKDKTVINPGSLTKGRRGHPRGYALLEEEHIEFIQLEDII
ncbi:hypothetical protein JCM15415_21380 [Methanobacterium movens]